MEIGSSDYGARFGEKIKTVLALTGNMPSLLALEAIGERTTSEMLSEIHFMLVRLTEAGAKP